MRAWALIHRWSSLHVPYRRLVSAKACWLHSPVPARLYNLLHLCFRLFLLHTILIPQDILSPVTGCVPVPLFLSLMYSTLTACLVLFFADFRSIYVQVDPRLYFLMQAMQDWSNMDFLNARSVDGNDQDSITCE